MFNLVGAVAAQFGTRLPDITALGYEYVVAANGLFIRAENKVFSAMVPVCEFSKPLIGLEPAMGEIKMTAGRVPANFLTSIYSAACNLLPNESMFQIGYAGGLYDLIVPTQLQTRMSVAYEEHPDSYIDVHTHGMMEAFWSATDNKDERGLKLYVVIGGLPGSDGIRPQILCRVGVYGYMMNVPARFIFNVPSGAYAGPFVDVLEHPSYRGSRFSEVIHA